MDGRRQLTDGFGPVPGGVHGGLHPSLLQESQFAAGLNITTRGGYVSTRPGFTKVLDLGSGVFQSAARYRLNEGDRIIFVQSGRIKQIKLFESPLVVSDYSVQNTTWLDKYDGNVDPPVTYPYTESFSPEFGKDDSGNWSTRINMVKADKFFVVQDGYHQPVIIGDGPGADHARVSAQSPLPYPGSKPDFESAQFLYSEVPAGGPMAYASRRLCVSPRYAWEDLTGVYPAARESGRTTFVASDLDSDAASCLRFIENNFANGGGALSLPLESGFITAMAPFRNSETVDGNGALVVFGQDAVSAFNLAFQREAWGSSDNKQPISQMLFQDVGTYSPRAIVPVNDDLFFRRVDGLGSLRYTASQAAGSSGSLSITPQSFEISHRLDLDTFEALPLVSMDYSGNRLFVTSGGLTPGGSGFRGLVVLDSASLYSMSSPPTPVYDDIWTGLDFLQVVSARHAGKDTLFIFAKCNGSLGLYKIEQSAKSDDGTPILCRFYTRQFSFGGAGMKKFSRAEIWIRELVGPADLSLYWRSDGYALWKKCNDISLNSDAAGLPQSRYRLTLSPTEENPCDPNSGRPLRAGTSFQFCIEWRGALKLEKVLLFADAETAVEPMLQCEDEAAVALVESEQSGVSLDDFVYSSCG